MLKKRFCALLCRPTDYRSQSGSSESSSRLCISPFQRTLFGSLAQLERDSLIQAGAARHSAAQLAAGGGGWLALANPPTDRPTEEPNECSFVSSERNEAKKFFFVFLSAVRRKRNGMRPKYYFLRPKEAIFSQIFLLRLLRN